MATFLLLVQAPTDVPALGPSRADPARETAVTGKDPLQSRRAGGQAPDAAAPERHCRAPRRRFTPKASPVTTGPTSLGSGQLEAADVEVESLVALPLPELARVVVEVRFDHAPVPTHEIAAIFVRSRCGA
jgi:hypothetical protein